MRKYNLSIGLKNAILCETSPVDEFYSEEIVSPVSGYKTTFFLDPLYLLLNQQRLNSLGTMGVEAWLAQFQVRPNSPLAELRKKCTDEQLATMIRSRHLQAPAEILAWSRYMQDNMSKFEAEVKQLAEAQVAETNQTAQNVESVKSE